MACSKCGKKRTAPVAKTSVQENPLWLIKVVGYEGLYTLRDGTRVPLGSGAFYAVPNQDILDLLNAGQDVTFPTQDVADQFAAFNNLTL